MLFASSHDGKGGKIARVIEFDVQLHRTFGGTKLRPVEQRQAEVNSRCVDTVERVFESELVLWSKRLTFGQHPFEDN